MGGEGRVWLRTVMRTIDRHCIPPWSMEENTSDPNILPVRLAVARNWWRQRGTC